MDGNSSLERRYSFNMVQHNPVAESTHLNGSSFCWGSSSLLSPKQRSNSSLCLNNTQNDSRIFVTSPHKSRNTTKIDARIVADVQSKGLASRIVKYHETGTRLNRSMSAHNLYSKPGQFPVVNLKKTQLPYRATKHNLSMTRIAPPEKSLFYGKTLSSLLRSNSVVGLQKSNEDLSHENRPILHYPPMENDMAPTRSVLDELKEISRKRINSDDLETTEASKKYCNRGGNDLVDTTGNNTTYVPPLMSAASKSFKRQREINALQQSKQMQELQISPEQAKKRLCNYNNDITSSLSSSNKCKTYERKRPSTYYLNQTMPTNLESYESQRAKIQRYYEEHNNIQADLRYEHLANNSRKEDDIIIKPIAPTVTQEQSFNNGVVPQRTASEPLYKLDDKKTTLNNIQPANKPRLTLFNKNYEVETENPSTNNGQEDDLNDTEGGDCAGIQFVKPKKLTTKCGIKNPVLERTNKTKLALMLSGLRGELYQANDMDELDATKTIEKPTKVNEINNDNEKIAQAIKDSQLETSNNTINKGILITTTTTSLTTGPTLTTANTTLTTPTKTTTTNSSSPLVGLKLTPQKSTTAEATKSSETPVKSTVPVLGGFSFGTTNTTLTPTLAITPSNKDSTKESTAETGINKLPQTSLAAAITNTNTTPVLSFGANLTTAKEGSVTNGQFTTNASSFSSPATSAIASNSSNTVTTSKPTASFSFGISPLAAVAPNNASTKLDNSATLTNSSKPNASFNFGINSTNTAVFGQSASNAATTSTTSAAPTSNTFSFGTNSTAATSLTAAASTTTTTSAAPTLNTFSFGTNSTATPAQQTSAVGVFGAPRQAATTTNNMTSTSFSFGTTSNPPTTNTTNSANGTLSGGFSFGGNTTPQNSTSTGNTLIKPTNSTTPFNFGSSTASGSNNGPSTAMSNNTSSVFNSNNNTAAPSVFGATSPPVFGAGASQPSVFGTPSNNAATNVFGSANSTSTSIFGSAAASNNPPTFGSNNDNKSTSMFGNNTPTAINNPPTFGSNTDNKSTSVFGNNAPANNTSSPFSFGAKPAEKPNNTPAFGSTTENKSMSVFGNNTNANTTSTSSPFSFGAKPMDKPIANNSNSTSTGGFSFGSLAANAKTDNKPSTESAGGFSFGSAAKPLNSSTFSFGSNGNSSLPPTNLTNSNNTNSFSFGGAAAAGSTKPNDTSLNKPFSFGTSAPSSVPQSLPTANNNSSSNIFGSAAGGQVSKPASPAFNFGSNTNIQTNAVAPSTNNIFAPPPAQNNSNMPASPGNRPIRRATRRLQK